MEIPYRDAQSCSWVQGMSFSSLLRHSSAFYHLHHHWDGSSSAEKMRLDWQGQLLILTAFYVFRKSPGRSVHRKGAGTDFGPPGSFCSWLWRFGFMSWLILQKERARMNKKWVHLVGRDICRSLLPLTETFSNVILRCRNQMDNEIICHSRFTFCFLLVNVSIRLGE